MKVKREEYEARADVSTVEETEATRDLCPANVATKGYRSCGQKMRRYRSGVTVCPIHGDMH